KLGALKFTRENGIPTLGICLGLQCMIIEYARNVAGIADASSSEFDPDTKHPVVATIEDQIEILASSDMGHSMRLGAYEANLEPNSLAAKLYGADTATERHRHRYEVNNQYRELLEEKGLVISGVSPDGSLVEYVELPQDV